MKKISNINETLPKHELDKNRFRVKTCPCGKDNKDGKFVPFVGYENKGFCHSCGKTFLPEISKANQRNYLSLKTAMPEKNLISFIPVEIFKTSLDGYEKNCFVKFLVALFGMKVAKELICKYFIGTSDYWPGATVFWQIDSQGRIRTGKIMMYNSNTGKRVKEPFNHIAWVHKALKQPEFDLKQCLFGEHLLKDKTKPVAIVESEKTAIIASAYLPQFIWLAVGSRTGLNVEKCIVLKGRTVALFPDLNAYKEWNTKAKELSRFATFSVSDLLERKATEEERRQGLDIADYLIRFNPKEFRNNEQTKQPVVKLKSGSERTEKSQVSGKTNMKENDVMEVKKNMVSQPPDDIQITETIEPTLIFRENATPKKGNWDTEIKEIEQFFTNSPLPEPPIKFDRCTTILNPKQFIDSHLDIVRAQNGKPTYKPYLDRLIKFKEILSSNYN